LYKNKVSITSDATLSAELANCRDENFCSPILRVASVRIYENLVEIKVKDMPRLLFTRIKSLAGKIVSEMNYNVSSSGTLTHTVLYYMYYT